MNLFAYLRSLTAKLFHRSQLENEMEEELRSHIQHRADDLQRSGIARAEAERQARIEFGAQERFKEESFEALGGNFIETAVQDVRVSLRVLRKTPGFTITAVFTLALAIGANAVVFSALNGLILRPLNVPNAQSLYGLQRGPDKEPSQSYPDYLDLRERNHSFDDLAAYNITAVSLDMGQSPARLWGVEASGNYFDVLGIQPYLGRLFHASDEHGHNSAPYIVLSYKYWHNHFNDDRGVVGQTMLVNKHPFTIIGVTPPEFRGTLLFLSPEFFFPMINREQADGWSGLDERGSRWVFMVMGHLKAGVSPAQAIADLNSIGADLQKSYPKDDSHMSFTLARPGLYGDYLGGPVKAFTAGLMLLAGLILLAACANLGSLFGARAADRAREVALRLALGSSRSRILRGLFTEAMLISLVGGTIGVWGSVILLRALSVWQPFSKGFPVYTPITPDTTVYIVALLLSVASGLLFGAVPVRQILRTNPYEVIKLGSTGKVGRRISVRDFLLVAQIAICAVLVTSSMVAVRGLVRSLQSNVGFDPRNSMLVDTDLNMAGYSGDQNLVMQKRMVEAVAAIPGVESVGLSDLLPLDDQNGAVVYSDKTTDLSAANVAAEVVKYNVSPEYFHAERTVLLSGRAFSWHDDKSAPRVAVLNTELGRKLFGSAENAVGGYFKLADGTRIQVVGTVETGKYSSLTEDPTPAMFLPILQWPSSSTELVVRSELDPQLLGPAIRGTLQQLDAALPVRIQTRYKEMDGVLLPARVATISLGVLGLMGAMLSVTGIFGMAAYSVSKRLKELGIRMALGAQRKEILQAALGRFVKLLAFGSTAGLILGLLASKVLALIVYHATPRDPLVLVGVVVAMSLLGLIATWIPAQRALSVNPLILLREE